MARTVGVTTAGRVPRGRGISRSGGSMAPTTKTPGQGAGKRSANIVGTPGRKASYVDGKAPGPVTRMGRKQAGYKAIRPRSS